MTTNIEATSLGATRLPNESGRAYRAFCSYRDLGTERSLDRAWERFCSDQGKHGISKRRPGHWALWSSTFKWVERAGEHDDSVDEKRRSAASEQRRQLQEARSRFAVEEEQRSENQVRSTDSLLERLVAVPLTEVTQVTIDKVTGKKTTTKVKPPNPRDIAALMIARNQTAKQVFDRHGVKDFEEERQIERVVWRPAKDRNRAGTASESHQGNQQRNADSDEHPADSEAEEAA